MKFGNTDTLHINKNIHFQQIAAVLNVPIEEIRMLNPQYKRDIIAGSSEPMVLVLPVEYIVLFELMKDSIASYNKNVYFSPHIVNYKPSSASIISGDYKLTPQKHTVKKGESLNIIAKKYRTTAAEIAKNSKIKTTATIHPGQQLIVGYTKTLIPKPKQDEVSPPAAPVAATETVKDTLSAANTTASEALTEEEEVALETNPLSDDNAKKYVIYEVEEGDDLFQIATKFKPTTVEEIMEENQLNNDSILQVGQSLKIPIY